jgi:hypothetical protein
MRLRPVKTLNLYNFTVLPFNMLSWHPLRPTGKCAQTRQRMVSHDVRYDAPTRERTSPSPGSSVGFRFSASRNLPCNASPDA